MKRSASRKSRRKRQLPEFGIGKRSQLVLDKLRQESALKVTREMLRKYPRHD